MKIDPRQFRKMLNDNHISVLYSGPLWAGGIDGMAEMILKRLAFDDIPLSASQAVFSIFVEQMNNMMMYSAERELKECYGKGKVEVPKGSFILGLQDTTYFIQTENVVTNQSAAILKTRIDYLNTLDKKALRQYYKERMSAENDNPESKGAGIGLIEIARRASGSIVYELEPCGDELQYFTIYIRVEQKGGKE